MAFGHQNLGRRPPLFLPASFPTKLPRLDLISEPPPSLWRPTLCVFLFAHSLLPSLSYFLFLHFLPFVHLSLCVAACFSLSFMLSFSGSHSLPLCPVKCLGPPT